MKLFIIVTFILFTSIVEATVRVGIIDSGINLSAFDYKIKLCENSMKDFTGTGILDTAGHGTNIAGIIAPKELDNEDYCLVIVKFFDNKIPNLDTLETILSSLVYIVVQEKIDILNLSLSGNLPSQTEKLLLTYLKERNIIINVAAGNESFELDNRCSSFPACYKMGINVVGNLTTNGEINKSSNRGSIVTHWRIGTNVRGGNIVMTGTSQATAVLTHEILKQKLKERKTNGKPSKR